LVTEPADPAQPLTLTLTVGQPRTLWLYGLDPSESSRDIQLEVDAKEKPPNGSDVWIVADREPVTVAVIQCVADQRAPISGLRDRLHFGIAEEVEFRVIPYDLEGANWTSSHDWMEEGGIWTAPLEQQQVSVSCNTDEGSLTQVLQVMEPDFSYLSHVSLPLPKPGWQGTFSRVTFQALPGNVSFLNLYIREQACPATELNGIFNTNIPPAHSSNGVWNRQMAGFTRMVVDDQIGFWIQQISGWGTFAWNIPVDFKVGSDDSKIRVNAASFKQSVTVNPQATVNVRKFGHVFP
jgi:hypothetical protein